MDQELLHLLLQEMFASLCAFVVLIAVVISAPTHKPQKWSWDSTRYFFIFGDSYTTVGYNTSMGTDYDPGFTSSGGKNWVEYLSGTYNKSVIEQIDLAYGGATVDKNVVPQYEPTVIDLKGQVQNEFLGTFVKNSHVPWQSDNTLFASWIGINDVGNSYQWTNISLHQLNDQILSEYFGLLEQLYNTGARNFLLLTIPTMWRSPLIAIENGGNAPAKSKADITDWNAQLQSKIADFEKTHKDVNMMLYDTIPLWNDMQDHGSKYGFKETQTFCPNWDDPAFETNPSSVGCDPIQTYFWFNDYHPTYHVHDILAQRLENFLTSQK